MADIVLGWRTAAKSIGLSPSTLRNAFGRKQLKAELQRSGAYAFAVDDLHAFKTKYEAEAKIRDQLSELEQILRSGTKLCTVCRQTHPALITISLTLPPDAPCKR
jgi:hypothetical protein